MFLYKTGNCWKNTHGITINEPLKWYATLQYQFNLT